MVEQVQIGPYKLQEKLGYGGMAVVYHAIDTRDDRAVALKILLPQYYNDDAFMRRFSKEGLNAQRLHHPNIVQTYAAGHDDGFHYIAMQFINGPTLEKYLVGRGPLSLLDTIRILGPISAALDYAHSLGYIHRDLKLNNIMRSADGHYLLTDFGVSKHLSTDLSMMTGMGQSIGTPSYMSPEQARGERVTNSKSDIYSLGVIAYRLLTGQVPFSAQDPFELTHKIIFYEPLDPRRFNPKIDEIATQALLGVLAKDPAERPASCQAFVDSLSGLDETKETTGFNFFPSIMFRSGRSAKPAKQKRNTLLEVNPEVLAARPKPVPQSAAHRAPQATRSSHKEPREQQRVNLITDSTSTIKPEQFAERINAEHVHALRTEAYSEITQPGHMPTTLSNAVVEEEAHTIVDTQELTQPAAMNMSSAHGGEDEPVHSMRSMSAQPHLPRQFVPGEPLPGQPSRTRAKRKTTVLTRGVRPKAVYDDFREEEMRAKIEQERIEQLSISSGYYGAHDWFDSPQDSNQGKLLDRIDNLITWLYRMIEPLTRRFRKGYNLD